MSSLRHPNTLLLIGACVKGQPIFFGVFSFLQCGFCFAEPNLALVTEYCEKGNLFELLHDSAQLIDYNHILKIRLPCFQPYNGWEIMIFLFFSVSLAEDCAYLHGNSPPILHGDLKSLNNLVDSEWNVKVSDFGLTRFQGTKSSFSSNAK